MPSVNTEQSLVYWQLYLLRSIDEILEGFFSILALLLPFYFISFILTFV